MRKGSKIRNAVVGFIFVGLAFLWGCLPEPLDVTGLPLVKPQIVVSSQMIPDGSLVVMLTKTFGALDASDDSDPEEVLRQIAVTDATVTLRGPDGTYDLTNLDNGVYATTFIAFSPGDEYRLDVVSETLGEVTATTTVRPLITFDNIDAELYFNGYNDTLAQITYRINDPEEENWYMLNVQEVEREDIVENLLNPRAFTRLMDDKAFNGQMFQETFRVFPRDFSPGDTIAVTIANISKEYYDFMELRLDNRYTFVEYLSEPVNYPTNIEGGRGFFNLYAPDVRTFVLDFSQFD